MGLCDLLFFWGGAGVRWFVRPLVVLTCKQLWGAAIVQQESGRFALAQFEKTRERDPLQRISIPAPIGNLGMHVCESMKRVCVKIGPKWWSSLWVRSKRTRKGNPQKETETQMGIIHYPGTYWLLKHGARQLLSSRRMWCLRTNQTFRASGLI